MLARQGISRKGLEQKYDSGKDLIAAAAKDSIKMYLRPA